MDIDYTGNMIGTARFNWDGVDGDYDIAVSLPLVIDWIASYPEDKAAVQKHDVSIYAVRVANNGCWRALEHAMLPAIAERLPIRDEIADWINQNWDDLGDVDPLNTTKAEHMETEKLEEWAEWKEQLSEVRR